MSSSVGSYLQLITCDAFGSRDSSVFSTSDLSISYTLIYLPSALLFNTFVVISASA